MRLISAAWFFSIGVCCAGLSGAATMEAGFPAASSTSGYFADKPIPVYYYRPKSAGPDAEVLIALHGAERDGKLNRNNWIASADKLGIVIIAPEFDEAHYPNDLYQIAGINDADSAHRPTAIIESLFDKVRAEEGLSAQTYKMFGHSAGGAIAEAKANELHAPFNWMCAVVPDVGHSSQDGEGRLALPVPRQALKKNGARSRGPDPSSRTAPGQLFSSTCVMMPVAMAAST